MLFVQIQINSLVLIKPLRHVNKRKDSSSNIYRNMAYKIHVYQTFLTYLHYTLCKKLPLAQFS